MCWLAMIFQYCSAVSPRRLAGLRGQQCLDYRGTQQSSDPRNGSAPPQSTTTPCASTHTRSCRPIWKTMRMGIFGSVGSILCSPPSAEQVIVSTTRSEQRWNELQAHTSRMSLQVALRFMSKPLGKNCWK